MSEPISDPHVWQTAAKALWGILITLGSAIGVGLIKVVREHDREISRMKSEVVSRENLEALRAEQRKDMSELRESLNDSIRLAVDKMDENTNRQIEATNQVLAQMSRTQNTILDKLLKL